MKLADMFTGRDLADHIEVPVLLSTDAADRIVAAERQVERAQAAVEAAERVEAEKLNKPRTDQAREQLQAAQAELDAAQDAAREHLYEFRFTSIGSEDWEALVLSHPPTKKQRELYGRELDFNPDTFPVAAVAVCLTEIVQPDGSVEPVDTTPDDVRATIKSKVKQAVWQQLWGACYRVNVGRSQVPLSLSGSGHPRSSDTGSEPPTN